jgi:hypothetical protein
MDSVDVTKLVGEWEQLRLQFARLTESNARLQAENTDLAAEGGRLRAANTKEVEYWGAVKNHVQLGEADVERLKVEKAALEAACSKLTQRLEHMKQELAEVRKEIARAS